MTDQPTPDTTDASLERAEEQAAIEAARLASAETGDSVGQAGAEGDAGLDAAEATQPKVIKARPRPSEPVVPPSGSGQASEAARAGHPNGSGNGSHREVTGSSTEFVRADTVSVRQGSVQTVEAATIDIRQGAAARVEARDVTVTSGAIGFARADRVSIELGAAGAAIAGEAHLTQSAVNAVIAREVRVEQSLVQTVIAADVRFERPTAVVFLVARKVEGEVRAILDWRGALVFGVAAGFVMSLFRRRR